MTYKVEAFTNTNELRTYFRGNDPVGVGTVLYGVRDRHGRWFAWSYKYKGSAEQIVRKAGSGPNWDAACNWRDTPEETTASDIRAEDVYAR